jgi:hypothetical protein
VLNALDVNRAANETALCVLLFFPGNSVLAHRVRSRVNRAQGWLRGQLLAWQRSRSTKGTISVDTTVQLLASQKYAYACFLPFPCVGRLW